MANLYMSRILMDREISCEIMYAEIFEKLGLKREKLSPYEGYDIQAFNDTVTRPWAYIKLMVTLEDGIDTIMVYQ